MNAYSYEKSFALYDRAEKVIPCGIYGHLGVGRSRLNPMGCYPLFVDRAEGTYIWDVDGNRFIDYACAYGPNVLGYQDPDVDEAALAQQKKGNCTTVVSSVMIECAEELIKTVNCADWAFFAKNGGDVTTLAVMVSVTGLPSLFKIILKDPDESLIAHQQWIGEIVRRGVYISHFHNMFTNVVLTDADLQYTFDVADEALKIILKVHPEIRIR